MVIRFHCASCSQPIEIDGEWALKPVACPYCRKTVTAPAESQIDDVSRIPTAAPAVKPTAMDGTTVAPFSPDPLLAPAPVAGDVQGNATAMAAFILSCVLLACSLSLIVLVRFHADDMKEIHEKTEELMAQGKGILEITQQPLLDQYGGVIPAWLVAATMLQMLSIATWVAVIVCSIIGLRRPYRRRLAVSALAIAVVLPLFLCCGAPMWMGY